jgi:hypothetical protein
MTHAESDCVEVFECSLPCHDIDSFDGADVDGMGFVRFPIHKIMAIGKSTEFLKGFAFAFAFALEKP